MKATCEKIRYRDKREALKHMQKIQRWSNSDVVPCRAYFCMYCNGWHLTSQENKFNASHIPTKND